MTKTSNNENASLTSIASTLVCILSSANCMLSFLLLSLLLCAVQESDQAPEPECLQHGQSSREGYNMAAVT